MSATPIDMGDFCRTVDLFFFMENGDREHYVRAAFPGEYTDASNATAAFIADDGGIAAFGCFHPAPAHDAGETAARDFIRQFLAARRNESTTDALRRVLAAIQRGADDVSQGASR